MFTKQMFTKQNRFGEKKNKPYGIHTDYCNSKNDRNTGWATLKVKQ